MVQAANVNVGLTLEAAAFVSGAEQARRAMQNTLGSIQADVSKSQIALSALTGAVQGFGAGLVKATAGYVSFQTIAGIVTKAARSFAEAETAQIKFASVLKATGGIAGVTADEVNKLADALEGTGTTTSAAVLEASAALGAFKTITGDTFTRVIELASDMSNVLGGDVVTNTRLLARALLEPGEALEQLRKKGVAFTDAQVTLIQKLQETGQTAAAQKPILDALAATVGGGTTAQANSLTAAFNAANSALGNLLARMFESYGASSAAENAFRNLQATLDGLFAKQSPAQQFAAARAELESLQKQLASEQAAPIQSTAAIRNLELQIAKQQELMKVTGDRINAEDDARRQSESAAKAAQPSGVSSKTLFPDITKQQIDDQIKVVERAKEAEAKLAAERKTAAAEARRLAEQKAALIARLDEEVAASERLTEAVGKGAYAQELANIENDKQSKILEASKTLKGEELEQQRKKIELLAQEARLRASISTATPTGTSVTQRAAETTSYEEYQKDAPKILADRVANEKKAADKLADIYAQPFKDLATKLSNTLSSGIQDALSGDFDFSTISESFSEIFADTLAAAITSAIQEPLNSAAEEFGKVLMNAFSDAAATQAAAGGSPYVTTSSAGAQRSAAGVGGVPGGVGTTPAGGVGYLGYGMAGAAFGGIAGGLYGQYAPGMKPGNQAALGGAIGGGLGAAAGAAIGTFLIPGLGTMGGAVIGGALGTAAGAGIGGMFGGQNNLGNDRSVQAYRPGRGLTYSDESFSAENRQVTQGIIDQLTALQEALKTAGGAIGDFGLRIEAGNKTGITVNGRKYPDAQAALAASLEVLIGSTTGMTASQQTVLANTKAKDAQGIVADLGVAEQFDALTFTGTALEAALKALDRQMRAFAQRAGELGLNVDEVAAAHQREAQALVDAQTAEQNQIKGAIEAIAPSGSALEVGLAQLNDQVQELAKAATAAGLPLDQLAAAHVRAASQLYAAAAQAKAAVNLQIAQINPTTNPLDLQLMQLQAQIDSLKPALDATGQSYDALAQAHQAAAAKIIFDYETAQRVQREAAGQARAQAEAQARAAAAQARENERQRQLQLAAQRASVNQQIAGLYGDNTLSGRLKALAAQIKELAQAAADAGVPIRSVTDAHKVAAAELVRVFSQEQRGFYAQLASVAGDTSLTGQFYELETQMREMRKAALDLGIPLANVTKAYTAAGNELTRVFHQQIRGFFDQLANLAGDQSLGTQLHALETQFLELRKVAADLGYPIWQVAAAHKAAAEEIIKARRELEQNLRDRVEAAIGGSALQQNLNTIRANFRGLIAEAQDLGWATGFLSDAWKRAEEAAIAVDREARRALQQQINLLDASELGRELAQIGDQFRDLRKAAEDLGWATGFLTQEQEKAEQKAIEAARKRLSEMDRSLADAQRSAAGAVEQFLGPLKEALSSRGIGQGVYAGATLTESALKEFREALQEARTGDTGALGSLVGIGQGAIQQARQTYGSTAEFARIFEEVQRGLQEQAGVLEAKRDEVLTQIGSFTRETVDELIRLRTQAIADLRADIAKLSKDIVVAVEGRA